jgi:O-antigen/teichoic acid export membrane protein
MQNWVLMEKERYDIVVEPKAGKVGVVAVFLFGVLSILVVFVAAYMWTDADSKLAVAIGVASIAIPTTVGFFVSELHHQRAGAFWFVLAAAVLAGGLGAWSIDEREDFENRMNLIAPNAVARIESDGS